MYRELKSIEHEVVEKLARRSTRHQHDSSFSPTPELQGLDSNELGGRDRKGHDMLLGGETGFADELELSRSPSCRLTTLMGALWPRTRCSTLGHVMSLAIRRIPGNRRDD